MPAGVLNRAADNWRPLLAIADAAGGELAGTRSPGGSMHRRKRNRR